MVTSADDPLVTTADGWSIVVDRLILGIGGAGLLDPPPPFNYLSCNTYSEARYGRLLDARLPIDQKLGILFGLGQCTFSFVIMSPFNDTLLGENVTQADKDLMAGSGSQFGDPRQRTQGVAIDFAATATRGPETKQVRWRLRQGAGMSCARTVAGMTAEPIELASEASLAFHIGIRGAALFADDASPNASLRFDSIASADTVYGNGDGEITLDEVGKVTLNVARQHGPYNAATVPGVPVGPGIPGSVTLEDYINRELLATMVRVREDVTCTDGFGPTHDPRGASVRDASMTDTSADEGEASVDEGGPEE